jgi:hypothetical protein
MVKGDKAVGYMPTSEEAEEARNYLEAAILKFSDEARHPKERGTSNPDPTWYPRPSTLRYGAIRKGGWAWCMQAQDQQIVAYYYVPTSQEPLGRVTCHGQDRHQFYELLKQRALATYDPWHDWYDFSERRRLDQELLSKGGAIP